MVAGSNLSWQGIKKKAVYTEGAGLVCKCPGSVHWKGVYRVGIETWAQVHKFPHMGKFMHLIRTCYKKAKSVNSKSIR